MWKGLKAADQHVKQDFLTFYIYFFVETLVVELAVELKGGN